MWPRPAKHEQATTDVAAEVTAAAHPTAKGKAGAAGGKDAPVTAVGPRALPDDFKKLIDLEVFAIEIGHGLLSLADSKLGGDLLSRVTGVRRTLAAKRASWCRPFRSATISSSKPTSIASSCAAGPSVVAP